VDVLVHLPLHFMPDNQDCWHTSHQQARTLARNGVVRAWQDLPAFNNVLGSLDIGVAEESLLSESVQPVFVLANLLAPERF
jgi:hypothetical protein